jgi:hypothetical protein
MEKKKSNCWDIKKCGRIPGGDAASITGICPAYEATSFDHLNKGLNGGRTCWMVSGTYCKSLDEKGRTIACKNCTVYQQIQEEEGVNFNPSNYTPKPT